MLNAISQTRYTKVNLKKLQGEIRELAKIFAKGIYKNEAGFEFSISEQCVEFENSFNTYNPSYIFDDDDFQKNNNPYFGLQTFGPSDKASFSPKDLRVLVICNSKNRGSFSNFTSTLEKGMQSRPDKTNYFAGGFAAKYKLHKINFELEEIEDYRIDSCLSTINKFLDRGKKPDLVILEIKREFKALTTEENPYFHVKAHLLGQGIPVQFVDNSVIEQSRADYAFFNLITLQMYAETWGRSMGVTEKGEL